MSQQGFQHSQQKSSSIYDGQLGSKVFEQNFPPNLNLSYGSSYDNIKTEYKNELQFNNNISKKNYLNRQNLSAEYNDLFEIEKKRKKQKYKRSTNNSHKKFISALRRLFYSVISSRQKDQFEKKYGQYKSCRTFFFIILAYMKNRFSERLLNTVRVNFVKEMKMKMSQYQQQVNRTKNFNLKNFREQEIIDIKYSIISCNHYLKGNTRQAIECMYKKDKSTVVKRQHYQQALKSVHKIQKELYADPRSPLQSPYIEDFSNSSEREKIQRKVIKREIRHGQISKMEHGIQDNMDFGYDLNPMDYQSEKKQIMHRPTIDKQNEKSEEDQISENFDPSFDKLQILYPPLLQAIPYIKYDPFVPPFRYKRQTRYRMDVREDFFRPFNYGFPKYYQKPQDLMHQYPQFPFSSEFHSKL